MVSYSTFGKIMIFVDAAGTKPPLLVSKRAVDVAASWLHKMCPIASSSLHSDSSSSLVRRPVFFRGRICRPSSGSISQNATKKNQRNTVPIRCNASDVSVTETPSIDGNWVPVIPVSALPRGERRLVRQDEKTILLLWYKGDVVAIENKSPAEGAYSEGLLNAKLTQDGCIVCPTTDSIFDLKTGDIKDWYPNNPVLRFLTPALRKLFVYPVKVESDYIYISMRRAAGTAESAEIVFSGKTQAGVTASDVNVDEVRMVVDEGETGFGFTRKNELINGRAATIGFLLLLNFELLTGYRELPLSLLEASGLVILSNKVFHPSRLNCLDVIIPLDASAFVSHDEKNLDCSGPSPCTWLEDYSYQLSKSIGRVFPILITQ
eukprot:Gb_17341 [translate_table: standard]